MQDTTIRKPSVFSRIRYLLTYYQKHAKKVRNSAACILSVNRQRDLNSEIERQLLQSIITICESRIREMDSEEFSTTF